MFLLDLDVFKEELEALKTSVNSLEREKRQHIQSKLMELFVV